MRKLITLTLLVMVLAGLAFSGAAAQSQPSSKVTAQVDDINILKATDLAWQTILSNSIKTANQKDLFVDVSLECGLYTSTKVISAGERDSSVAEAEVEVQVLVDGNPMLPGPVTFCRRTQTLDALFGGIMESCTDADGDGTITNDECVWTPEELELILDTMNANSFNYILADLGPGVHTVDVQAKIATHVDDTNAKANATIGLGSVTVESVRMIKDPGIIYELD